MLYPGIALTLQQAGAGDGALRGKVLIDCNNPVEVERFTLVTEPGGSLVRRSRGPNGTQPLDPNRFRSSR